VTDDSAEIRFNGRARLLVLRGRIRKESPALERRRFRLGANRAKGRFEARDFKNYFFAESARIALSRVIDLPINEWTLLAQASADESANAALGIFDQWQPDILISDIGMPEVDGNELIRIIREERGSRIPAVALTAMARIEDRLKALMAGYQMHVAKPVELKELIAIVSSLVGLVDRRVEP
jgi:CheY-like chemotaxis protein